MSKTLTAQRGDNPDAVEVKASGLKEGSTVAVYISYPGEAVNDAGQPGHLELYTVPEDGTLDLGFVEVDLFRREGSGEAVLYELKKNRLTEVAHAEYD